MSYIYLLLAIYFEVLGTLCVKDSHGFTHIRSSFLLFLYYALSSVCVTQSTNKIGVSIVYPVWTGSAIVIISMLGITYFHEPNNIFKTLSLTLMLLGLIGLTISPKF